MSDSEGEDAEDSIISEDLVLSARVVLCYSMFRLVESLGLMDTIPIEGESAEGRQAVLREILLSYSDFMDARDIWKRVGRIARYRERGYATAKLLRDQTPRHKKFSHMTDKQLIQEIGLDHTSYRYLLERFEPKYHSLRKDPRGRKRKLDAEGMLALVLKWLNSRGTFHDTLVWGFAATKSIVERDLWTGLELLHEVLYEDPAGAVKFPSSRTECREFARAIHSVYPPPAESEHVRVVGFVDGAGISVQNSSDAEKQRLYFSAWRHKSVCGNLFMFTPDGCISWATCNHLGIANDSGMAASLYAKLADPDQFPTSFSVVGDSIFRSKGNMEGIFYTTMKNGYVLPDDPHAREIRLKLNKWLTTIRQAAEWGIHTFKASFPRLYVPLTIDDSKRDLILHTCVRLYNFRTRFVGSNQIKSFYFPYLCRIRGVLAQRKVQRLLATHPFNI